MRAGLNKFIFVRMAILAFPAPISSIFAAAGTVLHEKSESATPGGGWGYWSTDGGGTTLPGGGGGSRFATNTWVCFLIGPWASHSVVAARVVPPFVPFVRPPQQAPILYNWWASVVQLPSLKSYDLARVLCQGESGAGGGDAFELASTQTLRRTGVETDAPRLP